MAFSTGVDVDVLSDLVGFLKDPSKMVAAASAGAVTAAPAKVEEKKEEVKEEVVEDVNLGGGLFGDEDEDW